IFSSSSDPDRRIEWRRRSLGVWKRSDVARSALAIRALSLLESPRFAECERPIRTLGKPSFAPELCEPRRRFLDRLVGKPKRSPVERQTRRRRRRATCRQRAICLDRVVGAHVNGAHEPAWL